MIKTVKESEEMGPPYEECYFCNEPTPMWSEEKDVPVCDFCASVNEVKDIESKKEWFERSLVK